MGEKKVNDSQVAMVRVGIAVRIKGRARSPIEEEKGMVGIGLVLDDLDD